MSLFIRSPSRPVTGKITADEKAGNNFSSNVLCAFNSLPNTCDCSQGRRKERVLNSADLGAAGNAGPCLLPRKHQDRGVSLLRNPHCAFPSAVLFWPSHQEGSCLWEAGLGASRCGGFERPCEGFRCLLKANQHSTVKWVYWGNKKPTWTTSVKQCRKLFKGNQKTECQPHATVTQLCGLR